MKPADREEGKRLSAVLRDLELTLPMPGISHSKRLEVLVEQIIESLRRNEYIQRLRDRDLPASSADPTSPTFDPLMAAIRHAKAGAVDDACWMVFLYVHFGKHRAGGWRYASNVFGKLGQGGAWDWAAISRDVPAFRNWLDQNQVELRRRDIPGGFGNHRKYESLAGWSPAGTGEVVASYVALVLGHGGHAALLASIKSGRTPEDAFEALYTELRRVHRFGRTAAFDYSMLLSKLAIAEVRPGHSYLEGATGPLNGARALFGTDAHGHHRSAKELRPHVARLQEALGVSFDVIEDALCNWQKSPGSFKPFRG